MSWMGNRRQRPLVFVTTVFLAVTACAAGGDSAAGDPPSGGDVRVQGVLSSVVQNGGQSVRAGAGNRSGSGTTASSTMRALSSAAVNVAALPVVTGELQVEDVRETELEDDGSFEVDVPVEADDDSYVFLVNDPGTGVGLEQAVGWLELPVGGELSTGWPLGAAGGGTTVELGAMTGAGDSFAPGTSTEELYETLGVDQAELLFAAQRDNALRILANRYLNLDADLQYWTNQYVTSKLNDARDQWTTAQTVVEADDGAGYFGYFYGVNFESELYSWSDFSEGSNEFVLTPPDTVTPQIASSLTFGPENPLGSAIYWPNGGEPNNDLINGVGFVGPPPQGLWTMEVNGELDGVYDLSFSSLYDEGGNFLYFIPSFRVNTDSETDRILSFELRFLIWDFDTGGYRQLPLDDVPVEWYVSYGANTDADPDGVGEELDLTAGIAEPTFEIYWPTASGGYQIWDLSLGYSVGELSIDFIFQPDYDQL